MFVGLWLGRTVGNWFGASEDQQTAQAASRWNRWSSAPSWAHWYDYLRRRPDSAPASGGTEPTRQAARAVAKPSLPPAASVRYTAFERVARLQDPGRVRNAVRQALAAPRWSEQEDEEEILMLLALME